MLFFLRVGNEGWRESSVFFILYEEGKKVFWESIFLGSFCGFKIDIRRYMFL